ncbi:MAG: hypothetical protein Hens3KO_24840 [Henriciella sp.]
MRLKLAIVTYGMLTAPAFAQGTAPIEIELNVESTLVGAADFDSEATDTEPLLGEISLSGSAEKVLENGVRIRGRADLRYQHDHPKRPGGTGGFGSLSGAPVGAFSGLSNGQQIETSDDRARFETAYLQIDGGYGELRAGKGPGIAARFYEGPQTALSYARLDTALLDTSGLGIIRSRHDLTGPSAKISYASPRMLGLRAGISYTPSANADGLDRRPAAGTSQSAPDMSNAVELALNGTHRFRSNGLRIDGMLAWSRADTKDRAGIAPYGTVETVSAGTRLEFNDFTIGGSWLESNNGLPGADYRAWSSGIGHEALDAIWTLTYGEAEDDGSATEASAWRLGVSKSITDTVDLGFAFTSDSLETSIVNQRSEGVVVEITLLTEILKLTRN